MAKCRACGKFLSITQGAATCKCSGVYHKACVAIAEGKQIPTDWKCPECKGKIPKTGNVATPGKDITSFSSSSVQLPLGTANLSTDVTLSQNIEPDSLENKKPQHTAQEVTRLFSTELGLEIRLFRDELREVRQEFKELRQEINDLRCFITNANDRIDSIDKRICAIESQNRTDPSLKIKALEQTIERLKSDINDRDQDILQSDIEVSNLPEITGENPYQISIVLAAKLGLSIKLEDIVFAERVGKIDSKNIGEQKRCRRLVVRLSRRQLRDEFIHNARVRRGATSDDLGIDLPPKKFYVNERLTYRNRQLFHCTREAAKKSNWKYTWTKKGRIYTRQDEGRTVHNIRSEEDLVRVFGSVVVRSADDLRT